jgi:hypothetical protein
MKSPLNRTVMGLGIIASVHVHATTITFFTDPSLIGKDPGGDGYWGTADDFLVPGFNNIGAATVGRSSAGAVVYARGTRRITGIKQRRKQLSRRASM